MRFFIVGVSCVGKTAIGLKLAGLLGYQFFDLDDEIEACFSMPIEKLQDKFLNMNSFRKEASKALSHLLSLESSKESWPKGPGFGLPLEGAIIESQH